VDFILRAILDRAEPFEIVQLHELHVDALIHDSVVFFAILGSVDKLDEVEVNLGT
jgi:hypothetical protein